MQYKIYEGNMERLRKKMTRIQNKCKKYGCEFSFTEIGEEFKEVKDDDGNKRVARFVIVDAVGNAVVNGWRYVATIEHHKTGNIILGNGTIEVPNRYYDAPIVCEHCGVNRYRKNAHIIYNEETGEFKEVGSACLCDFTHGMNAEAIASYVAAFEELIKGEAPSGSGWGTKYYDKMAILRYACETVRLYGYEKDGGTKERAFKFYLAENDGRRAFLNDEEYNKVLYEIEHRGFNADSKNVKDMVDDALSWISAQEDTSNYIHNLKVVCGLEFIDYKKIGYLVSLFPAWNNDLKRIAKEEERKKNAEKTKFFGTIGERIEINVNRIEAITGWETQFGMVTVYKITDDDGNVFTWKTTKYVPENVKTVKGTIKEHNEYCGEKQTEITRCRVA